MKPANSFGLFIKISLVCHNSHTERILVHCCAFYLQESRCACHEGVWGSGSMDPPILNLDTRCE